MKSIFKTPQALSIFLLEQELPELIADSTNLEGCNYTIPEIQTLLQNITVGGKSLTDSTIAQNQCNAWKKLIRDLKSDQATVSLEYLLQLHAEVAKEEALAWGEFRSSQVYIAGTQYTPPTYDKIETLIAVLFKSLNNISDINKKATHLFLQIARIQPFFDGNKRTGRMMMNCLLITNGLTAINLPASRQLEFNEKMQQFYIDNNEDSMHDFLLSCRNQQILSIYNEEINKL